MLSVIQHRQTLTGSERLKSKKLIGRLFKEGKAVSKFPLRAIYLTLQTEIPILKAGFTVSTKHFKKAVERNKVKRLMREAYRKQKGGLQQQLRQQSRSLFIFFIYTANEVPTYHAIEERMSIVIEKLSEMLEN